MASALKGEEHRQRHLELHHCFDELVADWVNHHPGGKLSSTSILELMAWSEEQTRAPTERPEHLAELGHER